MILIFKNTNTVVCATDKSGENKNKYCTANEGRNVRCTPGVQYFISFSNSNRAKRNHLIDIIYSKYLNTESCMAILMCQYVYCVVKTHSLSLSLSLDGNLIR